MNLNSADLPKPSIELRPSGIAIVRDDFDQGLNPHIWSNRKIEPGRLSFQNSGGMHVAKIDVHQGDKKEINKFGVPTERDELLEHPDLQLPLGSNAWYAFSFCFPHDFPIEDNRTVFAQWKQRTPEPESPFLSFRYQEGRMFCKLIGQDINEKFRLNESKDIRGEWHRLLVNYQLDLNKKGHVLCLFDDNEIVNYQGSLGFDHSDPSTYFKMGLYRDSIPNPQSIHLAQYRRGPTRQSCDI